VRRKEDHRLLLRKLPDAPQRFPRGSLVWSDTIGDLGELKS
jgi:hypothetical protein